jgi:hypothetical protein
MTHKIAEMTREKVETFPQTFEFLTPFLPLSLTIEFEKISW